MAIKNFLWWARSRGVCIGPIIFYKVNALGDQNTHFCSLCGLSAQVSLALLIRTLNTKSQKGKCVKQKRHNTIMSLCLNTHAVRSFFASAGLNCSFQHNECTVTNVKSVQINGDNLLFGRIVSNNAALSILEAIMAVFSVRAFVGFPKNNAGDELVACRARRDIDARFSSHISYVNEKEF